MLAKKNFLREIYVFCSSLLSFVIFLSFFFFIAIEGPVGTTKPQHLKHTYSPAPCRHVMVLALSFSSTRKSRKRLHSSRAVRRELQVRLRARS